MEARAWVGVDIHKKQFTVCIMRNRHEDKNIQYDRTSEGISDFLKDVPKGSVVGIESTTWTRSFAKEVEPFVQEVVVYNTKDIHENMDKLKKNDKTDAYRLALILRRFEREEITLSSIKSETNAEIKGLLNIREKWIRRKVITKNEIRSIIEFWGEESPEKMYKDLERDSQAIRAMNKIPETIKGCLLDLLVLIEQAEATIKNIDSEVESKVSSNPGFQAITGKVTGIGKTSGAYIVSKIEDVNRFDDPKKMVSYLGLAPKLKESDDKRVNMPISKRTDKAIMRVLIQAAWASIRFDSDMFAYYDQLQRRRGKQKAIVAVARKLVTFCYYEWKKALSYTSGA